MSAEEEDRDCRLRAFYANAPEAASVWPAEIVSAELERALREGRDRWPALALPRERFVAFIARRAPTGPDGAPAVDPAAFFAPLVWADLYLACACADRVPGAAEAFQATLFPQITAALRRMRLARDVVEDIQQQVFISLFLPAEGRARIEQYGGTGSLAGWVRVVAVRMAQNQLRAQGRDQSDDDLAEIILDGAPDPALEVLRAKYAPTFRSAFQTAVAGLSVRQRNLLRLRVLDGTTVTRLAELHGVHRMTVTRWFGEIRERVLTDVRGALSAEAHLPPQELDSLLDALRSGVDVTLSALADRGE